MKNPSLAAVAASLKALEERQKSARNIRHAKRGPKKPRVIPEASRIKLQEAGKRGAAQRIKKLKPELRSQIAREAAQGRKHTSD